MSGLSSAAVKLRLFADMRLPLPDCFNLFHCNEVWFDWCSYNLSKIHFLVLFKTNGTSTELLCDERPLLGFRVPKYEQLAILAPVTNDSYLHHAGYSFGFYSTKKSRCFLLSCHG